MAGNKNVKEMLKLWSREGGGKPSMPGNNPHKLDIVRKLPGREQRRNLPGSSEEALVLDEGESQEEGRKNLDQLTGSQGSSVKPGILVKLNDRKSWEDSKQEEEGTKEDTGRKGSKEGEKLRAKPRGRKSGTSGTEEPKLKITDLIRNYNSMDTSARSKEERSRSSMEEVMMVEKSTVRKKRQLDEEINLLGGSENKRCRTPLSTSERDKNKLGLSCAKLRASLDWPCFD